jgi:hypothetical protein
VTRQMQRFLLSSPVQSSQPAKAKQTKSSRVEPRRAEPSPRVETEYPICCAAFLILLAGERQRANTPPAVGGKTRGKYKSVVVQRPPPIRSRRKKELWCRERNANGRKGKYRVGGEEEVGCARCSAGLVRVGLGWCTPSKDRGARKSGKGSGLS